MRRIALRTMSALIACTLAMTWPAVAEVRPVATQPATQAAASATTRSATAQATDKDLQNAIGQAIDLLEKQDYGSMVKRFVTPARLARQSVDEIVREFRRRKQYEPLLAALKAAHAMTARLSDDGASAAFKVPWTSDGKESTKDMNWDLIDGQWYLR